MLSPNRVCRFANSDEGVTATAPDLFSNLQAAYYWSSEYTLSAGSAWAYKFTDDFHPLNTKNQNNFAWAVHDGNIGAAPLPAALWLFGSGLLGLVGVARKNAA